MFRQCHGPIPPTGMVALQSGSAAVQINSRSVLKMPQTFQQWSAVRHKSKNDGCHILGGQSSGKWNVHNFVSVFQKLTVNSQQILYVSLQVICKTPQSTPTCTLGREYGASPEHAHDQPGLSGPVCTMGVPPNHPFK